MVILGIVNTFPYSLKIRASERLGAFMSECRQPSELRNEEAKHPIGPFGGVLKGLILPSVF